MHHISRTSPSQPTTDISPEEGRHEGEPAAGTISSVRSREASAELEGLSRRSPGRASPGPAAGSPVRKELAAHDKQLAGYLMGRMVDGRKIEGEELERLRRANDTLQQTREALYLGRGNVTTDVAATNGHSARTAFAARAVRKIGRLNELPVHRAAVALISGTGNCGEHSAVAVHKLAAQLSEGEEAHSVRNPDPIVDHGWAELRTQDGQRPAIVLDAWGEGPALHAEDGIYSAPDVPAHLRRSVFSYDAKTAPTALEQLASFQATQGDIVGARIAQVRTRLERNDDTRKRLFAPTPITDPDFASRVREKMQNPNDITLFQLNLPVLANPDVRNDLLATGVLRDLGASVKVATAAARDVSNAASHLARAPQNPPRTHARCADRGTRRRNQ